MNDIIDKIKNNLKKTQNKSIHKMDTTDIKYTHDELNFINNEFPKLCKPYEYTPSIIGARDRIIVYGDLHGDLSLTIDLLEMSGLAKYNYSTDQIVWTGKTSCLVQVGDQIDRCRPKPHLPCHHPRATYNDEANDIKIMEIFNSLSIQAKKVGGLVISLLGNHELLNVLGRMDYVSYKGIKEFENYSDPDSPNCVFNNGKEARIHAFQPGHSIGRMLGCTRLPAVIIGTNLFVHAGIIDALADELNLKDYDDLEKINIKIKRWLLGLLDQDYVENIIKCSDISMFWSRVLGKIPPGTSLTDRTCIDTIGNVLELFKIDSIIIGHTPQSFMCGNDINSTCNGKIWRVDSGSSAAFNVFDNTFHNTGRNSKSRRIQYLEIINDSNYFICDNLGCKKEVSLK